MTSNDPLVEAALSLLPDDEKPLTPIKSHHRSRVFRMASGKTVRVRSTKVHKLVITRSKKEQEEPGIPTRLRNVFNKTDFVLIGTPEVENEPGPVWALLVPIRALIAHMETCKAVGHNDWSIDLSKWQQHRLEGSASVSAFSEEPEADLDEDNDVVAQEDDDIEKERASIAAKRGVPISKVKIYIEL